METKKEETLMVEVTIPDNSVAGDKITVQCPDNNYLEFTTPENVAPGDVVHVQVPSGEESESKSSTVVKEYGGVAAVTTGVVASAFVVGPLITGILVIGIVAASQRAKVKQDAEGSEESKSGEGVAADKMDPEAPGEIIAEPVTREEKIARNVRDATGFAFEKWSEFDNKLGISANTLKALATAQEIDERNRISATVVTGVKTIDEKYAISSTTKHVVASGYAKAQELDATCKLTENVGRAGTQFVTCVQDVDRQYSVTDRITTAFILGCSMIAAQVSKYWNPNVIANGNGTPSEVDGTGAGQQETKPSEVSASPIAADEVPPAAIAAEVGV